MNENVGLLEYSKALLSDVLYEITRDLDRDVLQNTVWDICNTQSEIIAALEVNSVDAKIQNLALLESLGNRSNLISEIFWQWWDVFNVAVEQPTQRWKNIIGSLAYVGNYLTQQLNEKTTSKTGIVQALEAQSSLLNPLSEWYKANHPVESRALTDTRYREALLSFVSAWNSNIWNIKSGIPVYDENGADLCWAQHKVIAKAFTTHLDRLIYAVSEAANDNDKIKAQELSEEIIRWREDITVAFESPSHIRDHEYTDFTNSNFLTLNMGLYADDLRLPDAIFTLKVSEQAMLSDQTMTFALRNYWQDAVFILALTLLKKNSTHGAKIAKKLVNMEYSDNASHHDWTPLFRQKNEFITSYLRRNIQSKQDAFSGYNAVLDGLFNKLSGMWDDINRSGRVYGGRGFSLHDLATLEVLPFVNLCSRNLAVDGTVRPPDENYKRFIESVADNPQLDGQWLYRVNHTIERLQNLLGELPNDELSAFHYIYNNMFMNGDIDFSLESCQQHISSAIDHLKVLSDHIDNVQNQRLAQASIDNERLSALGHAIDEKINADDPDWYALKWISTADDDVETGDAMHYEMYVHSSTHKDVVADGYGSGNLEVFTSSFSKALGGQLFHWLVNDWKSNFIEPEKLKPRTVTSASVLSTYIKELKSSQSDKNWILITHPDDRGRWYKLVNPFFKEKNNFDCLETTPQYNNNNHAGAHGMILGLPIYTSSEAFADCILIASVDSIKNITFKNQTVGDNKTFVAYTPSTREPDTHGVITGKLVASVVRARPELHLLDVSSILEKVKED